MDLNNLNDKQLDAVKSVGQPNLIFAGAGSGKTRVLTYKIASVSYTHLTLPTTPYV